MKKSNFFLLLLFSIVQFSISQQIEWINTFGGVDTTNDYDSGEKLLIDKKGYLIHFGRVYNGGRYLRNNAIQATFPNRPLCFIEKLDSTGKVIWRNYFYGSPAYILFDVDDGNNIILTGRMPDSLIYQTSASIDTLLADSINLTWPGGSFITKINTNGIFLWLKQVDALYSGLAVSPQGKFMLAGKAYKRSDIDPDTSEFIIQGDKYNGTNFYSEFDSNGIMNWARVDDFQNGRVQAIQYYNNEDIIFAGTIEGRVSFGNSWKNSRGGKDIFFRKMDSTNRFVWSKSYGGLRDDEIYSIDIDPKGNIIASGSFWDSIPFKSPNKKETLYSTGYDDQFILKLLPNGKFNWVKQIRGFSTARRIKYANNYTSILSCGWFRDSISVDTVKFNINSTGYSFSDMYYTILDSSGLFKELKAFGGKESDGFNDIVIDKNQNLYLTGLYGDAFNFNLTNSKTYYSNGRYDGFVLKISPNMPVGLNEKNSNTNLTLHPNPTSDQLFLSGLDSFQNTPYRIHDLMGTLIESGKLKDNQTIPVSHLKKGVYLLSVEQQGSSIRQKFIKQ